MTPDSTLSAIEDVLTDWNGSADSQSWSPDLLPERTERRMHLSRQLGATVGLDGYAALFVAADAELGRPESPWWGWVQEAMDHPAADMDLLDDLAELMDDYEFTYVPIPEGANWLDYGWTDIGATEDGAGFSAGGAAVEWIRENLPDVTVLPWQETYLARLYGEPAVTLSL